MTRANTFKSLWAGVVAVGLLAVTSTGAARQEKPAKPDRGVTNIVLVHGAWADGSSWSKVIPLLEDKGLHVVAVQLPLTSLAEDVASVNRALAREEGPVLLVAQTWPDDGSRTAVLRYLTCASYP